MPTADELKQRIEAAIPGARAQVESPDDVHFTARVSSPSFAGKSRVEQHRMVYGAFEGELGGAIHALSLKTEVPEQ
jgi:stress-induced morphogen